MRERRTRDVDRSRSRIPGLLDGLSQPDRLNSGAFVSLRVVLERRVRKYPLFDVHSLLALSLRLRTLRFGIPAMAFLWTKFRRCYSSNIVTIVQRLEGIPSRC